MQRTFHVERSELDILLEYHLISASLSNKGII